MLQSSARLSRATLKRGHARTKRSRCLCNVWQPARAPTSIKKTRTSGLPGAPTQNAIACATKGYTTERIATKFPAAFCTPVHRFSQLWSKNSIDQESEKNYLHARLNREASKLYGSV